MQVKTIRDKKSEGTDEAKLSRETDYQNKTGSKVNRNRTTHTKENPPESQAKSKCY